MLPLLPRCSRWHAVTGAGPRRRRPMRARVGAVRCDARFDRCAACASTDRAIQALLVRRHASARSRSRSRRCAQRHDVIVYIQRVSRLAPAHRGPAVDRAGGKRAALPAHPDPRSASSPNETHRAHRPRASPRARSRRRAGRARSGRTDDAVPSGSASRAEWCTRSTRARRRTTGRR